MMKIKNCFIFVLLPVLLNLTFIAMYFSGSLSLQQWVAPTIPGLPEDSWRELGLLEQLQNLYLLSIIALFVQAVFKRQQMLEQLFFFGLVIFFLFLFLEEMDYGLHYYEYFSGESTGIVVRNWHNEETAGKQNVRYLKKLADIMMVIWFIAIPLASKKISTPLIRAIAPSKWFIATFVTAVMMSNFAHFLEDNQFGVINGIPGNLTGNISEFREAGNYYLYLLYALQLYKVRFNFSAPIQTPAKKAAKVKWLASVNSLKK